MLLLGPSQVRAAPHDFKGPCQCLLGKMRSGASTTRPSVIRRGHGAPSGRHLVVLAGEGSRESRSSVQTPHAQEQRHISIQDKGVVRQTCDDLEGKEEKMGSQKRAAWRQGEAVNIFRLMEQILYIDSENNYENRGSDVSRSQRYLPFRPLD